MLSNTSENTILMASGYRMPVSDLKVGDQVQGRNRVNTVLKISYYLPLVGMLELGDSGLRVTAGQPIYGGEGGWYAVSVAESLQHNTDLPVNTLKPDTRLLTHEGDFITLGEIEALPANDIPYIEIELDGDHTFWCNGLLLHNKGGGGGGGTTIQKSEPPEYLAPYLKDIAKQAQAAYRQVPQDGFSGDFIAAPTGEQRQALDMQRAVVSGLGGFGQDTQQLAQQQLQRIMSGGYTAPATTQFGGQGIDTNAVINAAIDPIRQNLQQNIIPQVQSDAIASGAYGGSRFYENMGNVINDNFTREASNIAAQLGYGEAVRRDQQMFDDYTLNKNLMPELMKLEQAAIMTNPELQNAALGQQLMPSNMLAGIGGQEQLFNQDLLDEAYQKYLMSISTPFAGLDQYASIVAGTPYGGTNTATTSGGGSGGMGNILSGALGGGMMAYGAQSAFPATLGAMGLGGPVGLIGGALLGGLMGLF